MPRFDPFGAFAATDRRRETRDATTAARGTAQQGHAVKKVLADQLAAANFQKVLQQGRNSRNTALTNQNIPVDQSDEGITTDQNLLRNANIFSKAGSGLSSTRTAGRAPIDDKPQSIEELISGLFKTASTPGQLQERTKGQEERTTKRSTTIDDIVDKGGQPIGAFSKRKTTQESGTKSGVKGADVAAQAQANVNRQTPPQTGVDPAMQAIEQQVQRSFEPGTTIVEGLHRLPDGRTGYTIRRPGATRDTIVIPKQ